MPFVACIGPGSTVRALAAMVVCSVRFRPKCQGFVIAIATSSLHTSEEFSCVRQARTRRIAKKEQAEILQKNRVTKVLGFSHI